MKILQLCLSPSRGGLEIYSAKLANFLDKKIKVSMFISDDSQIKPYLNGTKNLVHQVKRGVISVIEIVKFINKEQIDIIHIHWTKDLPVAVLAKILSKHKLKLIQTRHMNMTRAKKNFYHRFLYHHLDLMITVTQQLKKQAQKFIHNFENKVSVSYIGTRIPKFLDIESLQKLREKHNINAQFVIGIIGRIEPKKGQHIVIEAFAKLIKQGIDAQLLIIGDTSEQNYLCELKQTLIQKDLIKRVIFTGFCFDIAATMQVLDTLVLATKKETFGMVLIEAMHAGICVIASDSGGPTEIINNNKNGLLFKTFDSDDLFLKIEKLAKNPDFRKQLAQNGQLRAQKIFAENMQFEQVLQLYHRLIK